MSNCFAVEQQRNCASIIQSYSYASDTTMCFDSLLSFIKENRWNLVWYGPQPSNERFAAMCIQFLREFDLCQ